MQRLHIHVNADADQLEASTQFYTTLFGQPPTKTRDDYAQWTLDDPRMNFVVEVIHVDGDRPGIHHVGIQAEDAAELNLTRARLRASEAPLLDVGETTCCFSKSDKAWTQGPSGIRWEVFRSFGDVAEYGHKTVAEQLLEAATLDTASCASA